MCLAQGPQRSDAGEARTRGPSVSSQALYHWATALPCVLLKDHTAVTPVRLEHATLRSRVKHSTTEPLRCPEDPD